MTKVIAKAPAKLMIAGEYSVLFGGMAIVAAVDRFAKASFRPGEHLDFFSQDFSDDCRQNDNPLWLAVKNAAISKGLALKPGDYCLSTEAFFHKSGQKYGLGSSAAGIVSLSRLMLEQNGQCTTERLRDLAFAANRIFSKVGSGADIAASSESRAILFRNFGDSCQIEPIKIVSLSKHFIFVFTNRQQNTRPFVAQALKLAGENNKFIDKFKANSDMLCRALLSANNNQTIIEIFNDLYQILINLGAYLKIDIVSHEHQEIFRLAQECKGSAKPSGAGGGDICLIFMPENKQEFLKKCEERGFFGLELSLL